MDAVLRADGDDSLHVWRRWLCEFLGAAREIDFEPRWMSADQQASGTITDVFERVDGIAGHECDPTRSEFFPSAIAKETESPLLHDKGLIFVFMVVGRGAAPWWCDLCPEGQGATGIFSAEVNDHFFAERAEHCIFVWRTNDYVGWLGFGRHFGLMPFIGGGGNAVG